ETMRLKPESLIVVGNRLIVVAFGAIGIPTIVIDFALVEREYLPFNGFEYTVKKSNSVIPVSYCIMSNSCGEKTERIHLPREADLYGETLPLIVEALLLSMRFRLF